MAIDPVCGMEVDENGALKSQYDGQTYSFCSRECKESFEEDPEGYLSSAA